MLVIFNFFKSFCGFIVGKNTLLKIFSIWRFSMSKGLVVLGDKTSHGGKVLSASSNITVDGKTVAVVGDMVNCPMIGHGTNPIVEGMSQRTCAGRAVVVDGCRCACGCQVISSAPNSTTG